MIDWLKENEKGAYVANRIEIETERRQRDLSGIYHRPQGFVYSGVPFASIEK